MTQEQYNRTVEITNRLNNLNKAKDWLKHNRYRLGYLQIDNDKIIHINQYGTIMIDYTMSKLTDIFDRHDKMIREEIDSEIEKLKKEIEEL